jgi:integrase
MQEKRINEFVFPATIRGTKRISEAVMGRLLEAIGRGDVVPHGFRSSFRTWAEEHTSFPHAVVEMALAHSVGDATERAYQRSDLLKKRRALAEAWSRYCLSPAAVETGTVLPMRTAR